MNAEISYRGFKTIIEFSVTDNVFFGKIEGIADLISFEGDTREAAQSAFMEAVDEYISDK